MLKRSLGLVFASVLVSASAWAAPSQPACDGDKHGDEDEDESYLCDGDKHGDEDEDDSFQLCDGEKHGDEDDDESFR